MGLEVVRVGDDAEGLSVRMSYGQVSVYLDGDGEQPVTPDATASVLRPATLARHCVQPLWGQLIR